MGPKIWISPKKSVFAMGPQIPVNGPFVALVLPPLSASLTALALSVLLRARAG